MLHYSQFKGEGAGFVLNSSKIGQSYYATFFFFSWKLEWHQNYLARHSERGKKTRQTDEEVERQHHGIGHAWSSPSPRGQRRTGENGGNWFAKSSRVPQRPSRLRDRWWWWWRWWWESGTKQRRRFYFFFFFFFFLGGRERGGLGGGELVSIPLPSKWYPNPLLSQMHPHSTVQR